MLSIKNSQGQNIYWQLIGIGDSHFPFLNEMGKKYPNCDYVGIGNIDKISDEDLFEGIINEKFAAWVKRFKK
ncbi:MAG: VWA domain-containing protein [Candidatus Nitrosotenuis sp.]